jgi:hypothetical protein
VRDVEVRLCRKLRIVVGKPGRDGHSNGAEQVAIQARDLGMEVIHEGIRLTPAQVVRAAVDEDVHVVGLSILSGSHLALVSQVVRAFGPRARTYAWSPGLHPAGGRDEAARPAWRRGPPRRTTNSPTSPRAGMTLQPA